MILHRGHQLPGRSAHFYIYRNDDKLKRIPLAEGQIGATGSFVWDAPDKGLFQVVLESDMDPTMVNPDHASFLVTDLPGQGDQAWAYLNRPLGGWDFRSGAGHKYRVKKIEIDTAAVLGPNWLEGEDGTTVVVGKG